MEARTNAKETEAGDWLKAMADLQDEFRRQRHKQIQISQILTTQVLDLIHNAGSGRKLAPNVLDPVWRM